MSPANLPQLPTDGGDINPALFYTEPGIPFVDDTQSLYEQETADPYKETAPFSASPISQGDTTFELPQAVAQPKEEGALERYMRAQREEEEAKRQAFVTNERRNELAKQDYLERRSQFDTSPLEMASEIVAVNKLTEEERARQYETDFGWLGGEEHPGWGKFKTSFYPEYDNLKPEEKTEVFDYWKNSTLKFWSGYNGLDPEQVGRKIDDVLIANEDVRQAETDSIINRRKASGYNPPGFGDGEWQSGNVGFDSTRANIFAANSLDEAKKAYEAFNRLKANQIVDEQGKLNQAGWTEYNRLMQGEENDLIQAQNDLNLLSKFGENVPAGIGKALSAAKDFSRLSQLAITNADPIVSQTLSGQKRIADPVTGSQQEVPLTGWETAKNILSNPGKFISFTAGMTISQQVDLLEENIAGIAIGAGTGGLAASGVSSIASGDQEASLVASDLFQQTMRDNGLDPYNLNDWQKAYDGGIIEKAVRDGEKTGQLKGQTTAGVGAAMDFLIGIGLKKIPVLGATATGLRGVARRMATSVPLSMVSEGLGEFAGQAVAFDKVSWNDVVAESALGGLGYVGFQTPAEIAKYTGEKIFGKPAETTGTTTTEPEAPTAESVPYNEPTQEEVEVDLENQVRNVQATGGTSTTPEATAADAQEGGTESNGQRTEDVTGTGQQVVASPAQQSAEAILNPAGRTTRAAVELERISSELDALESNLDANEERFRQSPEGAQALRSQLEQQQLGLTDEEFNQLSLIRNLSPAEREGYTANTLRKIATKNQPALTEQELKQMEFLKLLSPEEKKKYGEFQADKAASQSRSLINQTLAKRLEKRLALEEALKEKFSQFQTDLRQSDTGMELLRKQLAEEQRTAEAGRKGKVRTAQESFENEANPNEQFRQAFNPKSIDDIVGLSRQLETEPYVAPTVEVPANEFSQSFREENATLPERAQAAWTAEAYAAVDNFFATGNEESLAGLNKVQQNRAKSHYYGTIEERDAKAKGMSVEQAYNKRRNQGGFLDIPALGNGVAEAAVTAWTKAKDFAAWSAEMIENFGNKAVPYLRDLWNRLNSLIRNVGEFLTYTPNARARERGGIDARQSDLEYYESIKDSLPKDRPRTKEALAALLKDKPIKEKFRLLKSFGFRRITYPNGERGIVSANGTRMFPPSYTMRELNDFEKGFNSLPEYKTQSFQSKPPLTQQDRDYLAAVERGDMKTAQRMVDEAAKSAGYNIGPVFHGTQSGPFFSFKIPGSDPDDIFFEISYGDRLEQLNKGDKLVTSDTAALGVWFTENKQIAVGFAGDSYTNKAFAESLAKAGYPYVSEVFRTHLMLKNPKVYPTMQELMDDLQGAKDALSLRQQLINKGYDGVKIVGSITDAYYVGGDLTPRSDFVVFYPEQIKSADPVTRDEQGNIIPLSQRFNTASSDIRFNKAEGNPNLKQNQKRASLIRKTEAFFGGKIPNNVTFVNDRSEGNQFVARINTTLTGQADIEINYAFADDTNIDSALYEEIGHFASNRGMLSDFYNELTPAEKADVDAAVKMYGASEARNASLSLDALQAEERMAKSFAALATRNKDLWTRIKNLVNKVLSKLGLAPASTDVQVADIFMRSMNAYKNQRENSPDMSNRRMYLSKAATKKDLLKEATKIDKAKSSSIKSFINKINTSYLSKADRNALSKFIASLVEEAQGNVISDEAIAASKTRYDRIMDELRKYKDLAWAKEFTSLKSQYPVSLRNKDQSEFESGKEVRAYISSLSNEEAVEVKAKKEKEKDIRAGRTAEKAGEAVTLALEAQSKLPDILDSAPYKELSRENRIHTLQAIRYLQTIDPATQSAGQNESLVATINNALEGNILGFGKYSVMYSLNQFEQELKALLDASGGTIPFYENDSRVLKAIQKTAEAYVSGPARALFKQEARERMVFSSPQLRKLWIKHFGDYFDAIQTRSSALQNEIKHRLETIMEENGLQKMTYLGALKTADKDLFNTDIEKQKERIMYTAMMTQWQDGSENPIAEINRHINDISRGIEELIEYGTFQGAKGVSNRNSFMSVLQPAIDAGLVTLGEDGYEVQATPDVWSDFLIRNLKNNEANALMQVRDLAGMMQTDLKFTKEFWYGEAFEPVVNYVPRAAFAIDQADIDPNTPDLDSVDTPKTQDGTTLQAHGSVLHTRKGLARGQYYGSALDTMLLHSMNTAAYEIATAPARFKMNEILKDFPNNPERNERFLPFFGADNRSAKKRKAKLLEGYKEVHKAELKREVATKSPESTSGMIVGSVMDDVTSYLVNMMIGTTKNFFAQFAAPLSGAVVIAGKNTYDAVAQLNSWTDEQSNMFFAKAFPDLLNRAETVNFIFDKNVSSNALDAIASIDLKGSLDTFSKNQQRFIKLTRAKQAGMSAIGGLPRLIGRFTNAKSDAMAAQFAFPGLFLNRLIENGIIRKADEFVPSIIDDPRAAESLAQAKRDMSDVFGAANRFSLRASLFVDKSNPWKNAVANTVYGLMQIASGFAGDRVVDIKDMTYYNRKDPQAAKIRTDAKKRMTAALAQNATFKIFSVAITYTLASTLIKGFTNLEDLDDEERQMLANLDKIKGDIKTAGPKAIRQYLLESGTMLLGPLASNSLSEGLVDVATRNSIKSLLEEDYKAEQERIKKEISREQNPSKRADLQLQLAQMQEVWKEVNTFFAGPDFGPVVSELEAIIKQRDNFDDLEYDRIAQEYYKAGGPIKKPDRSFVVGVLRKGLGYIVPDIRNASNQIGRVRKEVARKREQKLESMKKQGKGKVDPINVPAL